MPTRNHSPRTLLLAAALLAAPPALAAPAPQTAEPAPDKAPERTAASFRTADELLSALEGADKDLLTLSAGIQHARDFGALEGEDPQIWRGNLWYASQPRGRFAVHFDQLILGNVRRNESKHYIFDGIWFVEKLPAERQMIKRRVVAPGEEAGDPLKIGAGPFPIPIGQKREDLLARFTAELFPWFEGWPEGAAPPALSDTVQLRLIPKPGTDESRDFTEIRVWYRTPDLLPRMARTLNADGGKSEIHLINLNRNSPIPDHVFDVSSPQGWNVEINEYRRPANSPG